MNLRRLRYFLTAAWEGSLNRAARRLGIAQPALTRQIQLLEAELGTQLFERSSRGLRLTETGEFLKDALEQPLREIEAALGSVRSYSTHIRDSLRLGLPRDLAGLIGPRLVERLQAELPNIALRIVEEDSSKLAADLARRLIDVVILVSVIPEQRVSRAQVLSEPLLLVGRPDALAHLGGSIAFRDLEPLPLVLPSASSGLRINLDHAAEVAGVKIDPVMEVDSTDLAKQIVARGKAFTILPERAFLDEMRDFTLVGLAITEPDLAHPIFWAVKPDWRLPRALYNELERVVIEEWHGAVTSGEWPASWVFDFSLLSIPFKASTLGADTMREAG